MHLRKDKCEVVIETVDGNRHRVKVVPEDPSVFITRKDCVTAYPVELIELILSVKGPYGLCDEIERDEKIDYVQISLKYDLLSYVDMTAFRDKRILDFGCGSGASTAILGRMFPDSRIIGLEMQPDLLRIAQARADHYQLTNVSFRHSPEPSSVPADLGEFDFILLSAVFEHLLPHERTALFPQIWALLKPGGVLFINQTPYRYFPVETHTTGLPFINYLPDRLAHLYAKRCSKRDLKKADWNELLRRGIRGCTVREILERVKAGPNKAVLMEPCHLGIKDRVDLWRIKVDHSHYPRTKAVYGLFARLLYSVGIFMLPHISIAIRKETSPESGNE